MITEIQITCFILMSMMAIILSVALPYFVKMGKTFDTARMLLSIGAALIAIHFLVQYILQVTFKDVSDIRTAVNLIFGFPITFFVNTSLVYLLRRGNMRKRLWTFIPISYIFALFAFFVFIFSYDDVEIRQKANGVMALLYASTLLFCVIVNAKIYATIYRSIKKKGNKSYVPLVTWTKWSALLTCIVSLGFPIMTFNSNLTARSFYGLITIAVTFFYMICFMGYGLTRTQKKEGIQHAASSAGKVKGNRLKLLAGMKDHTKDRNGKPALNEMKSKRMEICAAHFIQNERYTATGLTIKEACAQMGISSTLLKEWLNATGKGKYTDWITGLRISKAKTLLLEKSSMNDSAIALACGFYDRQHFQKVFRKCEGKSPYQWKKQQSGKIREKSFGSIGENL